MWISDWCASCPHRSSNRRLCAFPFGLLAWWSELDLNVFVWIYHYRWLCMFPFGLLAWWSELDLNVFARIYDYRWKKSCRSASQSAYSASLWSR
jgi:hypothetical protein